MVVILVKSKLLPAYPLAVSPDGDLQDAALSLCDRSLDRISRNAIVVNGHMRVDVAGPHRICSLRFIPSVILLGVTLLTSSGPILAAGRHSIRIIDAISQPSGVTVRGSILNDFLANESIACDSSTFVLFGNGRSYHGTAHCQSTGIAPKATGDFTVTFPPVRPGAYHLRYEKLNDKRHRFEMIPIRMRLLH
jgi:hypothetical protein